MSEADVVVYSTGWCPYCERAKSLLELLWRVDSLAQLDALDAGSA
jgi:glutaredoxin